MSHTDSAPSASSSASSSSSSSEQLLWYWATDWRLGLSGLANGILQLMHPGLGAGVGEHSDFFAEPWARIMRSVGPIVASIRDDDTARAIQQMHHHVKGTDAHGERYHALDPETFWWAHITLYRAVEQAARRFSVGGLSEAQRDAMYDEGLAWYRRYGVSDRAVPPTREAYTRRFREICTEQLELTAAAERAVDMALRGRVEGLPGVPAWMALPVELASTPAARLTSIGGLPSVVRQRFDIPWSVADDLQYRALIVAAREGSRFMPDPVRHLSMRRLASKSKLVPAAAGAR